MKIFSCMALLLAMVTIATSQAGAAELRTYLFESDSQAGANNTGATTPEANGGPAMTLLGPEGTEADAGGTVAYNGRVKKAENVLRTVPWGGATENTYAGYNPDSLSAALWFKSDGPLYDPPDNWTGLLGIGNSPGGSPDIELSLAKTDGGGATYGAYMQAFSWTGGNSWTSTDPLKQGLPGQVVLDDSTWHHVAFTLGPYDPSNQNPAREIYIDGQLAATGPSPGRAAQAGGGLQIGGAVAFGSYFSGWVDNLHVYDHELSAADVQNLYISETNPATQVTETDFTWQADSSGDWNIETHWSPLGGAPGAAGAANGSNHQATLGDVITSTRTVFSDSDVSLGAITFDSQHGYAVAGRGSLSLVAGTAAEAPATNIQVVQGQHEFQLRVSLETDTDVNVAAGQLLEFNNRLFLNDNTLTKTGDGTLAINNSVLTASGNVICGQGTCSGTGTIGGNLINSGGAISPGNSLGAGAAQVVPEPSAVVLLCLGSMIAVGWNRRHFKTE